MYGGRGVKVCDRWLDFEVFRADMGERPPGTSLDRIDNARGYSPDNCRWATAKEQMNNRTTNRLVTAFGCTGTVAVWADRTGIKYVNITKRLQAGWSHEDAVSRPVAPHKRKSKSAVHNIEIREI
jgi:hypothetical protein